MRPESFEPDRNAPGSRQEVAVRSSKLVISRRGFLISAGVVGAGALLPGQRALAQIIALPVTFTRTARRRLDFLSLRIGFSNLGLDTSNPPRLIKLLSGQPAYLVATFPPQHLADETLTDTDPLFAPGDQPTRVAGPSRLAFEVPDGILPLPFDVESLLEAFFGPLRVVPAANPSVANPQQRAPAASETAIEMPWKLVLSPLAGGNFEHATLPVTHAGRTELWHTRLGPGFLGLVGKKVQAVWSNDEGFSFAPEPPEAAEFKTSLTRRDRWEIVHLTSDRALGTRRRAVDVENLMMSSLGGWLDSRGFWDADLASPYALSEWRQRSVMARDSYVMKVEEGFFFPFGHRAALYTINERKLRDRNGTIGAYLVRREFILVRQARKEYGSDKAPGQPHDGRAFPFRSVEITTRTTPDLQPTGYPAIPKVLSDGTKVLFDMVATDWSGRTVTLSAPLVFVKGSKEGDFAAAAQLYASAQNEDVRRRPANGQKVAFAPEKKAGDTSFPVRELVFSSEGPAISGASLVDDLLNAGQPPFYPILKEARVRLNAVEELAGTVLEDPRVKLFQQFVEQGFPDVDDAAGNLGEVFLEMLPEDVKEIAFGDTARSGGIGAPNMLAKGLSRTLGPVAGDLGEAAQDIFDPTKYFDEAARLLGSLKLFDVLEKVEQQTQKPLSLGENGPKIQTVLDPKPELDKIPPVLPQRSITTLDWKPRLKPDPLGIFQPGNGTLELNAKLIAEFKAPDTSTYRIAGDLRDVELVLFGDAQTFLRLEVKRVKFLAEKDKKPDLDVQIGKVTFDGVLKFVEEFKNYLSALGKEYGVDVTTQGITVALALPIPTISVGVFSLSNLTFGFGARVPFSGKPARIAFAFSSREDPFKLAVAMFGGGGFFNLELGTDKSVMLEIALEFGASVAFDIGVASGGASIMAGIYFAIDTDTDTAALTGYLQARGNLSVLGLISISLELYLGFTYEFPTDKCIGRAKFHLEIKIILFTITVSAEVERRFGGEGDPTFAQLMPPNAWAEYCDAYAELAVAS